MLFFGIPKTLLRLVLSFGFSFYAGDVAAMSCRNVALTTERSQLGPMDQFLAVGDRDTFLSDLGMGSAGRAAEILSPLRESAEIYGGFLRDGQITKKSRDQALHHELMLGLSEVIFPSYLKSMLAAKGFTSSEIKNHFSLYASLNPTDKRNLRSDLLDYMAYNLPYSSSNLNDLKRSSTAADSLQISKESLWDFTDRFTITLFSAPNLMDVIAEQSILKSLSRPDPNHGGLQSRAKSLVSRNRFVLGLRDSPLHFNLPPEPDLSVSENLLPDRNYSRFLLNGYSPEQTRSEMAHNRKYYRFLRGASPLGFIHFVRKNIKHFNILETEELLKDLVQRFPEGEREGLAETTKTLLENRFNNLLKKSPRGGGLHFHII